MKPYLINSFSIRLLAEEINNITKENTNIVKMNMDEFNIDDVINECSYYSLLNETKFVIVSNFKLNKENSLITKYLENPHPDTTLILVTDKLDKRSVIYKSITKHGNLIVIDDVKSINTKISSYCKNKNITINSEAINELLNNNLNNYDLVLSEIDKINTYTNHITIEEVKQYSIKLTTEDNFGFSDAVINKNYFEIKKHLDDFTKLKSEVFPFIGLLANQYRLMYTVNKLSGSQDDIAKLLSVHPFRVKLAKEKSFKYTEKEIEQKLLDLCELDYKLKSTNVDKYILLKNFVVNV